MDGRGLGEVVEPGAGAVGADVAHVGGSQPRLVDGALHRGHDAVPVRRGHVDAVAAQAVAQDLGVDARAAEEGALTPFQQQHARSLAGQEPLTIPIERLTDQGGDGVQAKEAGEGLAGERVRSPAQHERRLARTHQVVRMADRVVPGGAGRGERVDLAFEAEVPGHVDGDAAGGSLRHVSATEPVQAVAHPVFVEALDEERLAVGRAHAHPAAAALRVRRLDARVVQRQAARGDGELAGLADRGRIEAAYPVLGIEPADLAPPPEREAPGVERRDLRDAALAGPESLAEGPDADADARHHAQAGDHDAVTSHAFTPSDSEACMTAHTPWSVVISARRS